MLESSTAHSADTVTGIDLKDIAIRDMLSILMRSLAADENQVDVTCVGTQEGVAFHVRCSADDVGRLIGNCGRTARAMRALLKAIASRNGRKYTLFIAQ